MLFRSEGSLNDDVSKQFMAQPFSIMAGGIAMLVLAMVPGMPKLQMIVLGGGLLAGGWQLSRRMDELGTLAAEAEAEQLLPGEGQPVSEEEYFKDINNVYSLIGVEAIEMEFGYSLIPLVDE